MLALRGTDGNVSLGAEARFIGFLCDVNAWFENVDAAFPVPFSSAALELLAEGCRAAFHAHSQLAADEPDHVADFSHRISTVEIELLFEVLRAANFLECEALLHIATTATAKLLGELRKDPEMIAAVLGVTAATDTLAYLPWGSAWLSSINEPILEPPEDETALCLPGPHAIGDEDALSLCLLACDTPTLRALKGLSPSWCHRARSMLREPQWQLSQHSLDLEWALGTEVAALCRTPPHFAAFPVVLYAFLAQKNTLMPLLMRVALAANCALLTSRSPRRRATPSHRSDGHVPIGCASGCRCCVPSSYCISPSISRSSAGACACSTRSCCRKPRRATAGRATPSCAALERAPSAPLTHSRRAPWRACVPTPQRWCRGRTARCEANEVRAC